MIPDLWEIEARVARGVAVLNQQNPGWRDHIAPGDLDMGACERCVLGQAYGSYDDGLVSLDLYDDIDDRVHGFDVMTWQMPIPRAEKDRLSRAEYELLRNAWLREIKGE